MYYIYRPKYHWGTKLWEFIHVLTINSHPNKISYNENANVKHSQDVLKNTIEQNNNIKYVLKNLTEIIPCNICKETYIQHLEYLDNIDMSEQMSFFYWTVDLHNAVNAKLNIPTITYDEALELWTDKDFSFSDYNKNF